MKSYFAEIKTRVAGIPCIVEVADEKSQWTVCDRRGRPAPWLTKKLTDRESDRINGEISNYFKE